MAVQILHGEPQSDELPQPTGTPCFPKTCRCLPRTLGHGSRCGLAGSWVGGVCVRWFLLGPVESVASMRPGPVGQSPCNMGVNASQPINHHRTSAMRFLTGESCLSETAQNRLFLLMTYRKRNLSCRLGSCRTAWKNHPTLAVQCVEVRQSWLAWTFETTVCCSWTAASSCHTRDCSAVWPPSEVPKEGKEPPSAASFAGVAHRREW
ncbi:hypothetical protein QBC43DRAFT_78268 [Cladorrhinum sp. PSN259]|nr:hypothetical protein QBC43DRAFT_78268 [Cladorrhinum sp. PSN259]